MKSKPVTNRSFFAKMLLLFVLVLLAHPDRRKGIEMMFKTLFNKDTVTQAGQNQAVKMARSEVMPASFSR